MLKMAMTCSSIRTEPSRSALGRSNAAIPTHIVRKYMNNTAPRIDRPTSASLYDRWSFDGLNIDNPFFVRTQITMTIS